MNQLGVMGNAMQCVGCKGMNSSHCKVELFLVSFMNLKLVNKHEATPLPWQYVDAHMRVSFVIHHHWQ